MKIKKKTLTPGPDLKALNSTVEVQDNTVKVSYGTGKVEGNIAKEKICFTESSDLCMKQFGFLSVKHAQDIEGDQFSGVVGLSPGFYKSMDGSLLPSFVEQMIKFKDENGNPLIDPVFSFYLAQDPSIQSKIILGGYDLEKYANKNLGEEDIIWHKLNENNDYFWSLHMNDKAKFYGGTNLKKKIYSFVNLVSKSIVIDTGLSYALAPLKDIISIANMLNNDYGIFCNVTESAIQDNLNFFDCDLKDQMISDLPTLQIGILTDKIKVDHQYP